MALETSVILRSLLFQAKNAKSVEEVTEAITVLCSGDDIAAVDLQIENRKKREASEKEKE